jgi:hypothetical protein
VTPGLEGDRDPGAGPSGDDGHNPFWWVWAFIIPFALLGIGLMTWRLLTTPERVLPGM